MTKLVNLTGRNVTLKPNDDDPNRIFLPIEGRARVVSKPVTVGAVEYQGMTVAIVEYHERRVIDLPDEEPGTLYIVSGVVADAVQRDDVWTVGNKLIAASGKIIAGRWLVRYAKGV
jgi:hypothetical protein